jgi:hypothetical protein
MPLWRKWVFVIILSTCEFATHRHITLRTETLLSLVSCVGNTCVSAAGSLISFFLMDYVNAGKGYQDITNLITVPTLSMVSSSRV